MTTKEIADLAFMWAHLTLSLIEVLGLTEKHEHVLENTKLLLHKT